MVEREESGHLKKGSVLNPKGRPKRKVEDRYFEIFKKAVSDKDWEAIIDKAVYQAKMGDGMARKFIADYLIGQPIQKMEHSGEGGGPLVLRVIYDE